MFKFFKRGGNPPGDIRSRVVAAFEQELAARGIAFSIEEATGRHHLKANDWDLHISLDNLVREVKGNHDFGRVARFVDTVLASIATEAVRVVPEALFWCLEPTDYVEKAHFREPVSDKVDRVLAVLSPDQTKITWVTPELLGEAGLEASAAGDLARQNLARELAAAKIEFSEIGGVRLGFLNTRLPFKASLLFAPNLRACVEATLGWPLQAVAPSRNFLYLWAARHEEFVGRVGGEVVKEYTKGAYPLSTEVYAVGDDGVRAIGAFPVGE